MPFFWLPEEGLSDRDRKEGGQYRIWKQADLLETTPGKAINFKAIIRRLAEIRLQYDLKAVAYDRWGIKTFNQMCDEEGVKLPLSEFGQGYVSMSPAVQALEAAVLDKRIHHGGHPILRWQIANAAVETDPKNNRTITKKRSIGHVDGLIALLMALGMAGLVKPPPAPKYQMIFV